MDHLKQRIPKLVLHKPEYKCTLMANEPLGDIEVVFTPEVLGVAGSYSKGGTSIPQGPNLRVRLSRLRQSVEISRHVPPASEGRPGTGEWVKKVLPVTPGEYALLGEALEKLESTEKTGWRHLVDFLMICQDVGPSLIPPLELAAVPDNSGDDRGRQGGRQRLKDVLERQEDANAVPRPLWRRLRARMCCDLWSCLPGPQSSPLAQLGSLVVGASSLRMTRKQWLG